MSARRAKSERVASLADIATHMDQPRWFVLIVATFLLAMMFAPMVYCVCTQRPTEHPPAKFVDAYWNDAPDRRVLVVQHPDDVRCIGYRL